MKSNVFKLVFGLILLFPFNGYSAWASSGNVHKKCIFELYQFRSPVISGCALTYNSNGLVETYTYFKSSQFGKNQVYTGQPGYGPQLGDKGVVVKKKCPRAVVKGIDKMFETSEVKSFDGVKSAIKQYAKTFMQGDMKVSTITFQKTGEQFDGLAILLGEDFSVKLKEEKGKDNFLIGSLENGMSLKFRDAAVSTLTAQGDFGSLDFKGGCN